MDGYERPKDGNAVRIEYVVLPVFGWKKEVPGLGVQARDFGGWCEDGCSGGLVIPTAKKHRHAKREMYRQNECCVPKVGQLRFKGRALNGSLDWQRPRHGIHAKLLRFLFVCALL